MNDAENMVARKKLPVSLKVVASYLVLSGAIGLIWPLIGLGPHHAEFQVKSLTYKIGAYSREITFALLFLASGIGLFFCKAWARKLALVMIALSSVYTINNFAWGFANGRPSLNAYLLSTAIVGLWNALWFYLVYRNKAEVLIKKDND